jgi:Ca-activated chloride channel family protein
MRAYRISNRWLYAFAREKRKSAPQLLRTGLISLAFSSLVIALAEPGIPYEKTYFNRGSIELAVGIDISKSMLAEDAVFPEQSRTHFDVFNRLNRARDLALNILSELGGEKAGIYIFAGKGVEIVPLTQDYGYCRYILRHINDAEITLPGSDLGEAIRSGSAMLEASHNKGPKIAVLLSDGEDIGKDRSSLYESARYAAGKGIKIYSIGIGSEQWSLIPIRNADRSSVSDYYTDEDGAYLKTKLAENTLREIAAITGGDYFRADTENAAKRLTEKILREAESAEGGKYKEINRMDLSPFFIACGLAFFIMMRDA